MALEKKEREEREKKEREEKDGGEEEEKGGTVKGMWEGRVKRALPLPLSTTDWLSAGRGAIEEGSG